MIQIPHKRRDQMMSLISKREDFGFFHNGTCMGMIVRKSNNTQSFFLKKCNGINEPLVGIAPHRESIC